VEESFVHGMSVARVVRKYKINANQPDLRNLWKTSIFIAANTTSAFRLPPYAM